MEVMEQFDIHGKSNVSPEHIKKTVNKKAVELISELLNVEPIKNDGTSGAIGDLLASESTADDLHIISEEQADMAGEMLMEYVRENTAELGGMGDDEKIDFLKKQAKANVIQAKNLSKISAAVKSMKSKTLSKEDMAFHEKSIVEAIESIAGISSENDWKRLSQQIIDELDAEKKSVGADGKEVVTTITEIEETKKLIDPSKGKTHTEAVAKAKTFEVEVNKKDEGNKESTMITEEVGTMAEKTTYNNYNKMSIEDVNLVEPNSLWHGRLTVPTDHRAYVTSPIRIEADKFINSTVKEIRNIKKQNLEDKETQLRIGRKINRKDIHRKDMKIWQRQNSPEDEEKDLSIYIALDFSGSTSDGLDKQIASVGVALIEALEKLKIKHTVMAYTSQVSIIKRGIKRTRDKYKLAADGICGTGGNNEFAVFKTVQALIPDDKEEDAVLIIITDGDGNGEKKGLEDIYDSLPKDKTLEVHSVGLNYDGGTYSLERAIDIYGKDNAHTVGSRKEFSKTIAGIIKSVIFK